MFNRLPSQQRKLLRRLSTVLQNSAYSLLVPILNITVSFLVIRLNSRELWGGFVEMMVILHLLTHIAGWGNKAYLLREFSRHPAQINQIWGRSLVSRLALYVPISILLLLIPNGSTWAIAWGLGIMVSQSFEVLIVYRKDFTFAIATELMSIGVLVAGIITQESDLTILSLTTLFAAVTLVKATLFFWRYSEIALPLNLTIDLNYFRLAGPFFVLGFSGILASRIDLYTVSALMHEQAVAEYQVFINLMLYLQALSAYILLPFIKNLYRMPDASIVRLSYRLFGLGLLILGPAMMGTYGLLILLYDIQYSATFMLLGGLFVLPIYGYIPLIHRLYKNDATRVVLVSNLVGAGTNFVLNLLLIGVMGIAGALLASAVVQWGMMAYYHTHMRRAHVREVPHLPADDRPIVTEA